MLPRRLLLLLLLLLYRCLRPTAALSPDGLSLLALKSAAPSPFFSDWNDSQPDPCSWPGVNCAAASSSDDPRPVVGLAIPSRNVRGYIPPELGQLPALRRLDLRGNLFSGPIPAGLFNASSLRSLILYGNNLSGTIPPEVGNLPRLQALDLSHNSISGEVPLELGHCLQLQRLSLAGNQLSGRIPVWVWANLGDLLQIDLSDNKLEGSLPDELGDLRSLSGTLNFSFNRLTGGLPESLGKLPETAKFDLRNNNFTGEIPSNGAFAAQSRSSFDNNPGLCGVLLNKPCQGSSPTFRADSGEEPARRPAEEKRGLKYSSIAVICVADAAGVTLIGLAIVYLYWKRPVAKSDQLGKNDGGGGTCCTGIAGNGSSEAESENDGDEGSETDDGCGGLVALDKGFKFELEELLRASAYVLGRSGPGGIVYKVVLGNGVPVAVRRLGDGGCNRYKEFAAAARAVARVSHPNLLKLRAFYWATDEKLLITDFIPNGNLAAALHGRSARHRLLPWPARLKIAAGVARGLAHIHELGQRKLAHGDIKPSNVLLDADLNPVISDFGLARLTAITTAATAAATTTGFIGAAIPYNRKPVHEASTANAYRAPEVRGRGGEATQRGDVYSFGVVLLEMVTGKPAAAEPAEGEVAKWVRDGRRAEEVVDPAMAAGAATRKAAAAALQVGVACTEVEPELRPSMRTVSEKLERIGR